MQLQNVKLHPLLKGHVEKIWVLEATGRALNEDMKIIVPNGLVKMVIPFKNGLYGKMQGWEHVSKEHSITLIGITDIPSVVDYVDDAFAGTIGVEFSPIGAYRFFDFQLSDIKNRIYDFETVVGKCARVLEEEIANEHSLDLKVARLQRFLIHKLHHTNNDMVFEFCIDKIIKSRGTVAVKELERLTGYSSRWLNIKFQEKLGVSPKNIASIVRFMQFYQLLAIQKEYLFFDDFYTYYYDQSHFIKEFKRFTGLAPTSFINANNDFGKIFYKG